MSVPLVVHDAVVSNSQSHLPVADSASAEIAPNVGFEELHIADGAEKPLAVGVWYPTSAPSAPQQLGPFVIQTVALAAPVAGRRLPLVVISHGGGGSYDGHYDTALALAHAGFVVAALSHNGDTYDDQSKVLQLWRRPAQLRRLVSYMLQEWPQRATLDPMKIGAFGFSNGGFTVLVAAGGVPELNKISPYCEAHPTYDLCRLLREAGVDANQLRAIRASAPSDAWSRDPRITAAVMAAPAFGFAFGPSGLANVSIPIQLWRAADDRHQPNPDYEEAVRLALPRKPEYHVISGAGHYDFLPPCSAELAKIKPEICADPDGFDRATFHRRFNAEIVRFFRDNLK